MCSSEVTQRNFTTSGVNASRKVNEMKIVGIDSSTKSTGLSFYENDALSFYTCLDFSKIKDTDERIKQMIGALDFELKRLDPDVVYVEAQWVKVNAQSTIKLAYIVGAIKHICLELGTGCNTTLPSQWRKAIGIKGKNRKDDKALAIQYVYRKHDIMVNEDVAEAICIGEYACSEFAEYESE